MGKQQVDFERFGAAIASKLERVSAERELAVERARRAFMRSSALALPTESGVGVRRLVFGLVALSMLLATAFLFVRHRDTGSALTFEIDGRAGTVHTGFVAQPTRPLQLDFSDGTRLRLEKSSRARVTQVARDGARIALESGSLHADVVHTGQSHWELAAGPLRVRVTGTRFDMHWNPVSEVFSIRVSEGSVAVSGGFASPERPVRTGESLMVSVSEQRLELTRTTTIPDQHPGERVDQEKAGALAMPESTAASPVSPPAPAPSESSVRNKKVEQAAWRELAGRGALREAFAAAEASGYDEACQSATASELLLLGDAARLAGRPERVSQALLTLRRRYPTDSRNAAAAFMLGKVAFDQRHAYAQAASWFSTSIREQPGGSLAREASGRLIEALRAAGDVAGARRAAGAYLARYPQGPHAALARSLLP